MMKNRTLIKLGGAALESQATLQQVARLIRDWRRSGETVVLVHGGGPSINTELRLRGIEWKFIGGQRVTTSAMMDVIETTLVGNVNHNVVNYLLQQDLPAVGFSGVDRDLFYCSQASVELGQVGRIEKIHGEWLDDMISSPDSPLPVVAPLGIGRDGRKFNINADWAASHLATALRVRRLVFFTDQTGILDEEGMPIAEVGAEGLRNMIDCKIVSGGMLTKTLAILHALENGVPEVVVGTTQNPQAGTQCRLQMLEEQAHASI